MVAVGDVKAGHPGKLSLNELNRRRLGDDPGGMPHAVGGHEVHIRSRSGLPGDKRVQTGRRAIDQEHRTRLGFERLDVAQTVVFLVGPGQLMLLNAAFAIICATCRGDQSRLAMGTHNLAVKVKTRLGILPKRALGDQAPEIFPALDIHFRRARIGGRR